MKFLRILILIFSLLAYSNTIPLDDAVATGPASDIDKKTQNEELQNDSILPIGDPEKINLGDAQVLPLKVQLRKITIFFCNEEFTSCNRTIQYCLEPKDFNTIFELSKNLLKDLSEKNLTLELKDKYAEGFSKFDTVETEYYFASTFFTSPALECLEPNDYYDAVMHFYNIYLPLHSITTFENYTSTSRYHFQTLHAQEIMKIFETKVISLPPTDVESLPI